MYVRPTTVTVQCSVRVQNCIVVVCRLLSVKWLVVGKGVDRLWLNTNIVLLILCLLLSLACFITALANTIGIGSNANKILVSVETSFINRLCTTRPVARKSAKGKGGTFQGGIFHNGNICNVLRCIWANNSGFEVTPTFRIFLLLDLPPY